MKNYNVEKVIDCLNNRGYSNFINQQLLKEVKGKLRKNEYKVYSLYDECNKVILYKKDTPDVYLFKIESKDELRHQDIMGTIYNLGINEDMFGDIIKIDSDYYLFLMSPMIDYFKYNLTCIRNSRVELQEVPISLKDDFKQQYEELEFNISSLRIDNVVSSITNMSRNNVLDLFKDENVILNYDVVKNTRELKENDVFSIKKYGKFKYVGVKKNTKKGFIITILKYR